MGGYATANSLPAFGKQFGETRSSQWGFFQAILALTLLLALLLWLLIPPFDIPPSTEALRSLTSETDTWPQETKFEFSRRVKWLEDSPLVITPGAAELYRSFAKGLSRFFETGTSGYEDGGLLAISGLHIWFGRLATGVFLRLGFVILAFWPFWLVAFFAGKFLVRDKWRHSKEQSILGVCDRGKSPFYSGIYGPFKPNNNFSGTDFSVPGLACPALANKKSALDHKLSSVLKEYEAFNETNLELVRVILAHADFPGRVQEDETEQEEAQVRGMLEDEQGRLSQTGFVTNAGGTLEEHALEGLAAVLEAHKILSRHVKSLEEKGAKSSVLNSNYPGHRTNLERLFISSPPLVRLLSSFLTPSRIWAASRLTPQIVATAYLAAEAGKSLVYKRHGQGFTRVSIFPQLQARAVLHAMVPYHRDYVGEQRAVIRHAIICSKRHVDFGRAFLPIRMPIESRVLRDWLEVMYADTDKREEMAQLVELDGHLEEIHVNWRAGFANRLRQEIEAKEGYEQPHPADRYWKGIAYKSVVLMSVRILVDIALRGVHEERKQRINTLLYLTRKHQSRIISGARLPGLKRQAMEAEKYGDDADGISLPWQEHAENEKLTENWRIVRRMLSRYNWLSTRVGDEAVPLVGLISGILRAENHDGSSNLVGLDGLVPLRQRRFVELFGRAWESIYYSNNPDPEDLDVYTDNVRFLDALQKAAACRGFETAAP